jgi:hypothetical protein
MQPCWPRSLPRPDRRRGGGGGGEQGGEHAPIIRWRPERAASAPAPPTPAIMSSLRFCPGVRPCGPPLRCGWALLPERWSGRSPFASLAFTRPTPRAPPFLRARRPVPLRPDRYAAWRHCARVISCAACSGASGPSPRLVPVHRRGARRSPDAVALGLRACSSPASSPRTSWPRRTAARRSRTIAEAALADMPGTTPAGVLARASPPSVRGRPRARVLALARGQGRHGQPGRSDVLPE